MEEEKGEALHYITVLAHSLMEKRKVHLPWGTGRNDGLPGSRHPSPLWQDIVFCVPYRNADRSIKH